MGENSIKSNLSKADIISEIILLFNADVKHERIFLLVEGEDDMKFWRDIVNTNVSIHQSFSGKTGILEIITEHFNDNIRVIGIRDRDYEVNQLHQRIFYYDYCCLEMMIINNDDVFKCIQCEYYNGETTANALRENILNELKYISIIRKNNEQLGFGIKIDGISLHNAFDTNTGTINKLTIISKLNEMNRNFFEVYSDRLELINNENDISYDFEQLLNITQGHDFVTMFNIYCSDDKRNNIKDKDIASSLRCTYRINDFEQTSLYSQIISYQSENDLIIVK